MALLQECVMYSACENEERLEVVFIGELYGCRKTLGRFCIEFHFHHDVTKVFSCYSVPFKSADAEKSSQNLVTLYRSCMLLRDQRTAVMNLLANR